MTATRRPLTSMVPDLLNHVKAHYESHIVLNTKLIDICNGNLLPYVQDSMQIELNPRAYQRSKERIAPINILKKLQTKTSKVYAEAPDRRLFTENQIDQDLMDIYIEDWNLDAQLTYVNELLVINKYAALEPYMNEGMPELRVLSAKDFIVYSDSIINPNQMTVFIKFMGSIQKEVSQPNINGLASKALETEFKSVAIFHAYSDDEVIVFDEDGDILNQEINDLGVIPFVYIRTNPNQLIPTPDSDNLPMVTLIPKLIADLNYSVMFGCRSQVVAIDVELDNVEFSPDSMWILNSVPGENKSPSLDTIKSDVDVEKVLELITSQLGMFLDSKGISTGSVGKATVQNAASGISKLIDESDATAINRTYKKIFKGTERNLWKLLPIMHNKWINSGESDLRIDFSSDFRPVTTLTDSQVVPNRKETLEELKIEQELGLMDKEAALRRLNPDLNDEEIQELLEAISTKPLLFGLNIEEEDGKEE